MDDLRDDGGAGLPPRGTVERWAWDYVTSRELSVKLSPAPPPPVWERDPKPRRIATPGRPDCLEVKHTGVRAKRAGALRGEKARARLLHAFLHHELQAAELMCWALLAFPDTPRAFREGLVRICLDEVRHMGLYREHMKRLGYDVGAFPVRDWFWERIPSCNSPVDYVSVMGMGLEGGNLDHSAVFAERFRAAGDEQGAQIQELVGKEEIAHVRFGVLWFERWTGGQSFAEWRRHLPEPLSPMLMRGAPINREARTKAGLDPQFLDALAAFTPAPPETSGDDGT